MSDHRQAPRTDREVPVRIKYRGVDDFLRAYTENISLGGVFVATAVPVPVGTRVQLTIELAPGKGLQALAEVAWHRQASPGVAGGVGLRFVMVSDAYRAWLDSAVERFQRANRPPETTDSLRQHQLRRPTGGAHLFQSNTELELDLEGAEEVVLGIDLGTSNTLVCTRVGRDPRVLELQDEPGGAGVATSVPSVVSFDDDGRATVGREALEGLDRNARRTVFGAKRFIGRRYESPTVQQMLSRFPYKVVPGPRGEVAIDINGKPLNLVAISARILRHVTELAGQAVRAHPTQAIITVPAYYNDNQRQAVVQAGRLAGLKVLRVLNEPTAAAIAYGLTHVSPRKVLVYDLGGGTFDVSVMDIRPGALKVLATAGDTFLGGEDFDQAVVDYVDAQIRESTGRRLSHNHVALVRVKVAAERVKRRLSTHEKSMLTVRDALLSDGSTMRLEMELSRRQLEGLVAGFVERTLKICDMALAEAKLPIHEIADVLLVGGQTLMPYVRERVSEHFGKRPRADMRPDEVVALGAGRLAYLPPQERQQFEDVLSMSIGVAVGGHRFRPLVPRNTPVPHTSHYDLKVPRKRFASFCVDVWQGDHLELHRNEHLGSLSVSGLQPGSQDPVPVRVYFILTPDCLLKVKLENQITGETVNVLLDTQESM